MHVMAHDFGLLLPVHMRFMLRVWGLGFRVMPTAVAIVTITLMGSP